MDVIKASCLLFLLSVLTVPVWADRPFVGLILYTLHKGNSYLLLANSQGAENIWAGFTADEEQSGGQALDSAIRDAVVASRCYFSFTQIRRSVDNVHFQEPWDVPRHVAYFAHVPRIRPQELEDDRRACPAATKAPNKHLQLRWVPWGVLRADIKLEGGTSEAEYVGLTSSARHLHGTDGKHFLLPAFAELMRQMLALSERKDSTIDFTLPW